MPEQSISSLQQRIASLEKENQDLKKQIGSLSAQPGSLTFRSPAVDPAQDPGRHLVRFLVETRYEDLPASLVDYAKQLTLDTLGIMIGGSAYDGIAGTVSLVEKWGGKKESTILMYGSRVPAPNAAFAMGPMARVLDIGDTHEEATHTCQNIVPALLGALGLKKRVTGQEFITALAIGGEVAARIADATFALSGGLTNPTSSDLWSIRCPEAHNWMGAAAAVAKLLGLDSETAYNALGIQFVVSGPVSMGQTATGMLSWQTAFAARNAINSAQLAQLGITGPRNIFAGPTGYLASYYPWKNDIRRLTADLGKTWSWSATRIKPYMTCYCAQCPLSAMEFLRKEYTIAPGDIASIDVIQSPGAYMILSQSETSLNPKLSEEAQFSLPYVISTMAIYGSVFVADFTAQALARPDVREMMKRVKITTDDKLPLWPATVKVTLRNGTQYSKRVDYPKGDPIHNPMTWDDVIRKFELCLPMSARPVPGARARQVIRTIRRLEQSENVAEIVTLLNAGPD